MASSDMEDLTLTKEESERLKEAFKDEKFVRLLQEYADEVNDPENRKKYEEDVIAVEKKYGNQVTFIHQEAGYVIKTSEEGEKKAFINVCQNDKVDKPSFAKEIDSGKAGTRWELPHMLIPPREDLDKSNRRCIVYDVIFHPYTLLFARNNERFRKMLDNVALDAIESKFDVKLDRTNVRFPKMKYKGCPMAPITRKKIDVPSSPKDSEDEEFDDQFKDLFKPPAKSFNWSESKNKKKKCEKQDEVEDDSATRPKYSIKYRNHIDIQDYTNTPHQMVNTRPHEIIVDIQLPLLNSAFDLNLDIYEKRLLLISNKKGASYKLDLALPYSVNENDGKAQFDKAKRKLCVTLKVLPPVGNLDINLSNKIKDDLEECLSNKLENDLDINQSDQIEDNVNEDLELKEQTDEETTKDTSFYSLTVDNMDDNEEFEKLSIDLSENKNLLEENSSLAVAANIEEITEMNDITERFEGNLHVDENEQETILENSQTERRNQEESHDCDLNMPLSQTIPYSVPKFDYYQTPKIVTLVIQVKNIDSSSIYTYFCDCRHSFRVTFYTLGEGFVPFYYCLFLKFEHLLAMNTETMRVSLSKDNLVLHLIKDANYCYSWTGFQAGLNNKQLMKYEFICKTAMLKTIQELKDESENVMAGDKLTNENVHVEDVSLDQVTFDINLKQSIQDQIEKEIDNPQDNLSDQSKQDITILPSSTKLRTSSGSSEDQNQSPLLKKRGILKYPRYYCRTISESSDDTFWSSLDNDYTPVGSLDSLGEKPKKCVRFNDQIAKTVFRANSSILGQRKKNQRKARNRKKTASKTSESDNCTETSEENSDYNSTNEAETGPIDVNTCGRKLYAWQENKNSENAILEMEKIQLSKNEFDKKEQLSVSVNNNNSIDSQYENDKMTNLSKSSQHFTFGLKENQKITIMQRPSTATSLQKPVEKSSSSVSNFSKSHCICKPGEKKSEKGSQKVENANGESKQKSKWRKRRRWRNKKNNSSHLPGASVGNQLLEQNVLKRNNNRLGEEEGCNWIYDNEPKYYNNQEVIVNKTFENCGIPNAFWMCNQSAEYDPQYRTKCVVNFANQVMFQLD